SNARPLLCCARTSPRALYTLSLHDALPICQPDDGGLGDVVGEIARVARPAAARDPVGEVDDAATAETAHVRDGGAGAQPGRAQVDRKSTRLNSSHVKISYAVFCLKKKNTGK